MPPLPTDNGNTGIFYLVSKLGQNVNNPRSICAARASIEIPMSSETWFIFLLEFIRFEFTMDKTILQQILAFSPRLGAKKENCNLVSGISSDGRSRWCCCIHDGESFPEKWCYQENAAADWSDEEFNTSSTLELLQLVALWKVLALCWCWDRI